MRRLNPWFGVRRFVDDDFRTRDSPPDCSTSIVVSSEPPASLTGPDPAVDFDFLNSIGRNVETERMPIGKRVARCERGEVDDADVVPLPLRPL